MLYWPVSQGSKEPHYSIKQVSMVSRMKHGNFVEMLGYCVDGNMRLMVYEFATMGSLHDVLHGKHEGKKERGRLARIFVASAARGNAVTFFLSGSSPTPATGRSISSSPSPACDVSTGATHRRSSSSASRRRHHPPPPPHCDSTAGHAAAGECFLLRFPASAANREERGVSSSLSHSSQVARPAAGLRPLLFSSSPLPVVGIASILLEMLPSEPPLFAGAAAGRPLSLLSLFSSLHRHRRTTAAFSRNRCHLPQVLPPVATAAGSSRYPFQRPHS
ncbi:hypothetical protein ZIOFF_038279 [Zingiber officinale]|uniref:Serine-threonine/tyrosine-protein kinase catalytic domain-containing protein n=1 Tax=Zingiber officinale TaxID=94328 RepID=A0A8J5G9P5_ZINOF|nr:hypothetical protein ZIOFF_038279 [Zingiber officinale]